MKVSEMNKILKDMKDIAKYKDSETTIDVRSSSVDPYWPVERVRLHTEINGIEVSMEKVKDTTKEKK